MISAKRHNSQSLDTTVAALQQGLIVLVVFVLALLPRVLLLDRVPTVDELSPWYSRTLRFMDALDGGNFAATYQIGHPGVTTMWLGSIGLATQQALAPYGLLTETDALTQLAVVRTPVAIVCTLAIALGFVLLRRLFGTRLALLATLLWACDPLLVAHSRVFHLDALLASFTTLSVLALLVGLRRSGRTSWVLASGMFAGLALLTKLPSAVLVPFALLACCRWAWQQAPSLPGTLRLVVRALGAWGIAALLTVVLLWPALWVAPLATIGQVVATARVEAGEGHSNGNFFLGVPDPAPGPLFYPAALVLRLTPWALLGLLLVPLALRVRRNAPAERRDLLLLALFALGFLVFMTLSPKKFDRYILPAFPALNILAAAGLSALWPTGEHRRAALGFGSTLLLGVLSAWTLAFYFPNYLSYYSPLLGGGPVAAQVLPIGWGEGYDEARDWLNAQVGDEPLTVAARSDAILGRRARFAVSALDDVPDEPADVPNYIALYISNVQRERLPPGAQWYRDNAVPANVIRLHGIDYVSIYQVPPPVPTALPASFGSAVGLRGYGLTPLVRPGEPVRLTLFWAGKGAAEADYLLFAHLIGPDGQRYAQADVPPGGSNAPTSAWSAGRFYLTALTLPLPATAPAGTYRVVVGFYNPATGERLAPTGQPLADPAVAGPGALELGTVVIP